MAAGRLRALVVGAVTVGAVAVVMASVGWPAGSAQPVDADATVRVAGIQLDRSADVPAAARDAAARGVLLTTASGCGAARQASTTVVHVGGGDVGLTNAHVVRGTGTVVMQTADGHEIAADVSSGVDGRDAARLAVDVDAGGDIDGLDIGPQPSVGSSVVVAGHPGGAARVAIGTVESIEPRSAFGAVTDVMVIDVQVEGGSSGGAVLDPSGRVVGLVAARDPETGDAVAYRIGDVLARTTTAVPTC